MSYQALLFCPDEKTARIVTQVLSDLEFSVEPCSEPFAAVKKLMAQHFDAIVVDCDNEQNAALLFKSARNSTSNQASLSVAVVEGQTGVAKAFRLGANLVLTKPIHIEQSKATLRVARGLLRKGQSAKPMTTVSAFPEPAAPSPVPAPVSFPAPRSVAPPAASASAFEVEAEPAPEPDTVDAALLEYMPDSAPSSLESSQPSASDSKQSKQYPWQPSKTMAEPMASSLRRAAEVAGKNEFENPPASQAAVQADESSAAAPARALEPKITPFESKPARPASAKAEETTSPDPSAAAISQAHSPTPPVEAAAPSSLDDVRKPGAAQPSSAKSSSKKGVLVAIVLLALAAAGYFAWTKMQSGQAQPAQHAATPTGMASQPAAPDAESSESQPASAEDEAQTPEKISSDSSAGPSSKPSAAVIADHPMLKPTASAKPEGGENPVDVAKAPVGATAPAGTLLVKNGSSTQTKSGVPAPEPEQPPMATSIATGSSSSTLTGLVNTDAVNAQRAAQQTLRISQGVSQGLLIKRVQPVYPPQALKMRLEGVVELQANISKTGNITGVKQLSGQAILARAAEEAVRQWKYKPYFLNGEPVEVETQVTVNFKLP